MSHPTLLNAKLKALAAHLAISVALVAIALALMWFWWFPPPLFATDGGGVGLKLLLLVDLVLGPLLTFVVFNPRKARRLMVLDLSVIAVLQLAAYGYGLHSIHSVRVQAVALHEGVFHAVGANQFKEQTIAADGWAGLGERSPYVVNVREPRDGDEAAGVTAFALTQGLEPYALQFLYQPITAERVNAAGWTLADLQVSQPESSAAEREWFAAHPEMDTKTARLFRLEGFYGNAVIVFDDQGRWRGGFEGELPARR